jgi:hypothetical protein
MTIWIRRHRSCCEVCDAVSERKEKPIEEITLRAVNPFEHIEFLRRPSVTLSKREELKELELDAQVVGEVVEGVGNIDPVLLVKRLDREHMLKPFVTVRRGE